ncbi:MAG TPA: hypothetical protein VE978_00895 [Chitinophagales bacterium]|nr:hypothetical protein [Chitinophagales bacterium]
MDRKPAGIDFALIGHQESWQQVTGFVNTIRKQQMEPLSEEKVRSIFPFIPPRDLFKIRISSSNGEVLNGVYIETFIAPDTLDAQHIRSNILKVKEAANLASKRGARIASLGGFTSIVIEGNTDLINMNGTCFTTGNTLTAAFIVKGVEKAAREMNLHLSSANLLVIGATGDIGQAVSKYFSPKVNQLLLCARNENRLSALAEQLRKENLDVEYAASLESLVSKADIIISVASATELQLQNLKRGVLICDAGYPKNLEVNINADEVKLFHGGMGIVRAGFQFIPDYTDLFYKFPAPYIVHGCILEAFVLCFENRIESFSKGKGNISMDAMELIHAQAVSHGIELSPLYNANGLWTSN